MLRAIRSGRVRVRMRVRVRVRVRVYERWKKRWLHIRVVVTHRGGLQIGVVAHQ